MSRTIGVLSLLGNSYSHGELTKNGTKGGARVATKQRRQNNADNLIDNDASRI